MLRSSLLIQDKLVESQGRFRALELGTFGCPALIDEYNLRSEILTKLKQSKWQLGDI